MLHNFYDLKLTVAQEANIHDMDLEKVPEDDEYFRRVTARYAQASVCHMCYYRISI
jgi:hypothetical protein